MHLFKSCFFVYISVICFGSYVFSKARRVLFSKCKISMVLKGTFKFYTESINTNKVRPPLCSYNYKYIVNGKSLFTWLSLVMSLVVSLVLSFSRKVSWVGSRTELSQFLSVFLPSLKTSVHIPRNNRRIYIIAKVTIICSACVSSNDFFLYRHQLSMHRG